MITSMQAENCYQLAGNSNEVKPTDNWVGNGSIFVEMDTGKVYIFDKENKTWKEL